MAETSPTDGSFSKTTPNLCRAASKQIGRLFPTTHFFQAQTDVTSMTSNSLVMLHFSLLPREFLPCLASHSGQAVRPRVTFPSAAIHSPGLLGLLTGIGAEESTPGGGRNPRPDADLPWVAMAHGAPVLIKAPVPAAEERAQREGKPIRGRGGRCASRDSPVSSEEEGVPRGLPPHGSIHSVVRKAQPVAAQGLRVAGFQVGLSEEPVLAAWRKDGQGNQASPGAGSGSTRQDLCTGGGGICGGDPSSHLTPQGASRRPQPSPLKEQRPPLLPPRAATASPPKASLLDGASR